MRGQENLNMRRMAIRFIGLAFAFPTMAQGVSQTDTEAGVDVAPITEQFNIDRSDRMTVQVRVNGSAPVPFIVDTGAERTVIARANSRWRQDQYSRWRPYRAGIRSIASSSTPSRPHLSICKGSRHLVSNALTLARMAYWA